MMENNMEDNVALYVSHLKKYFDVSTGLGRVKGAVKALDDVTFYIKTGETLGIVGETGCGKTTLGRTILRLIDPTGGDVYFNIPKDEMDEIVSLERKLDVIGHKKTLSKEDEVEKKKIEEELEPLREKYSLTKIKKRELNKYRKYMQPVFQDPFSSLDPRKLIKDIIAEPMHLLTDMSTNEIYDKIKNMMGEIGLNDYHMYRFPHEFSGGQRQRIGIARAISIEPNLLVLDEPTSALDVSVQAQILNMMKEIQRRRELTFLFISHHLSVIRMMSDRVGVMYLGQLVELTATDELFENMLHPYTKALLSAIPVPDPEVKKERIILEGEIPNPSDPPKGCYFHPRCPEVMKNCGWSPRDMAEPIKDMVDPYKNPDAANFPEIQEIVLDEENQQFDIVFTQPVSKTTEVLKLFQELVEKAAEEADGIRFRAIKSTNFQENGSSIRVSMMEPDIPKLKEFRKGHFVSCLIYDRNYWETEETEKDAKEADQSLSQS